MIVTFCGHSELYGQESIRARLTEEIESAILGGATLFYLGGYGAFDRMAAHVLKNFKGKYPHIQSILVVPYLNRKYDDAPYDGTIYPSLEAVPQRYAILHRNRWLVEHSDLIIAYVTHNWGGAASMLRYALRRQKQVINLHEFMKNPPEFP